MEGIFYHDQEIKYLDLSNFDISSVNNLQFSFQGCNDLIFINLYNFIIKSINDIFLSNYQDLKICINDENSKSEFQKEKRKNF